MSDTDLLDKFVASFHKFDDMVADGPVPSQLDGGVDDSRWARQIWTPARRRSDANAIAQVYQRIPARLPPMYEQLILSYRWLEVELGGIVRLLANPPGPAFQGLINHMTADPELCAVLFPLGLIPFGKASGGNYDPICFDTQRRNSSGDCPIVRVEHESLLCNGQVGQTWQVASTFRGLVRSIINRANKLPKN